MGGIITIKENYNSFLTILKKINSLFYRQVPEISHGDLIEWGVSASQLRKGEELMISGKAKPDKSIRLDVNFEISIPVKEKKYEHRFDDVAISSIPNEFQVEAYKVKNMTFTVRMLIPFKQYREAENGRAVYIDKDVPSGNYDIVINGETESVENVLLKIKSSQTIVSDSEGNFVYGYPTKAFPVGPINLFLGREEKEIKIIP